MFRIRRLIFCFLVSVFLLNITGIYAKKKKKEKKARDYPEKKLDWNINLKSKVIWQKVTDFGLYMVNTENGLHGINPATGEILWTNEALKEAKKEEIQEIPGSPYILISAQMEHHDDLYKAFDVKKSGQLILDPLSGTVIFNSDTCGLKDVRYKKICLKSNSLIVIGEHRDSYMVLRMESYDLTTGKLKWSTIEIFGFKKGANMGENMRVLEKENNDFGIAGDIYEVDKNNFIFSNGKKIILADSNTGKKIKERNISDFNIKNELVNLKYVRDKDNKDIFYLLMIVDTGFSVNDIPVFKLFLNSVNISDLNILWKENFIIKDSDCIFTQDDNGIILFAQNGVQKIYMVDSKTGKGLWGKKGSGLKIKGYVVEYYKVNDYYVLAFFKEGITAISIDGIDFRRQDVNINILDPGKGEFLFKKDVKMTGTPDNIELIPAGLLVHTSKEANIIDLKTGSLKFKKSIKAAVEKNEPREFPFLSLDDEYLIFSSRDDLLYSINKQSGKLSTICKDDILFGGDEYPHTIELREDDILIYSAQNIMRIDRDKNVIYEEFYPGVGARGIFLALKILKTIRTVNNSIDAAEISTAFEDLFETRSKSAVSKDYVFMLINLGNRRINGRLIDAVGLVRVDKNNGKPLDLIDLGADKEPDYEVDPIEERIFYVMPDRVTINGYQY